MGELGTDDLMRLRPAPLEHLTSNRVALVFAGHSRTFAVTSADRRRYIYQRKERDSELCWQLNTKPGNTGVFMFYSCSTCKLEKVCRNCAHRCHGRHCLQVQLSITVKECNCATSGCCSAQKPFTEEASTAAALADSDSSDGEEEKEEDEAAEFDGTEELAKGGAVKGIAALRRGLEAAVSTMTPMARLRRLRKLKKSGRVTEMVREELVEEEEGDDFDEFGSAMESMASARASMLSFASLTMGGRSPSSSYARMLPRMLSGMPEAAADSDD
eukprot:PLAT15488.3.p1 GENE.PLAT15488.3~~PLAT15488.3.p1  ORF type:complete len:305 (+),score=152.58 PLAT15488.3:100-915(+)